MTTRKKASDEATFFICWTLKKTVSRLEDDDGQAVSTLFSHDGTEGFAGIRFPHWEFWFHVHFLSARSLPPFSISCRVRIDEARPAGNPGAGWEEKKKFN
jgi:hypothetical protein